MNTWVHVSLWSRLSSLLQTQLAAEFGEWNVRDREYMMVAQKRAYGFADVHNVMSLNAVMETHVPQIVVWRRMKEICNDDN